MAVQLISRNTVVRGEFNRAIIVPRWLVAQEILPDGEVEFAVSDAADQPRQFRFAGFMWNVAHDRLMIAARQEIEAETGPVAARILRILSHTPVTAVGHNFLFESTEAIASCVPALGTRPMSDLAGGLGGEFRSSTCEVKIAENAQSSVTARIMTDQNFPKFDLNFHFAVESAESAARACNRSAECRNRANDLLRVVTEAQA